VHGGLDEEAHEAQLDTVGLLEFFLVGLAQGHHGGHVHFVERGQDGVGGLRLQQTLGDAGTQTGHGHALLGTLAQGHGSGRGGNLRQCGGRRASGDGGAGGHGGQHVTLGDAAVLAGASHGTGGQVVVGHQLGRSGHGHTGHAGAGGRSGSRCCGGSRSSCGRSGRGRCSSASLAFAVDLGDQLLGYDGTTVAHHDLGQHAGGRRGHFHHDLVGLDLDQDLVLGHGLTGLLFPGQQRGFGHGLGQLGNFDFNDCHFVRLFRLERYSVVRITWSARSP